MKFLWVFMHMFSQQGQGYHVDGDDATGNDDEGEYYRDDDDYDC